MTASQEEVFSQMSYHLNLDFETKALASKLYTEFYLKRLHQPSK